MKNLLSLCKRKGIFFPSNEIYSGQKGSYDYGHAGLEMKRNLVNYWWRDIVKKNSLCPVFGLETPILTLPKVFEASKHLDTFFDTFNRCCITGIPFRIDKAPKLQYEIIDNDTYSFTIKLSSAEEAARLSKQFGGVIKEDSTVVFTATCPPPDGPGTIRFSNNEIEYKGYAAPGSNSIFLKGEQNLSLMFKTFQGFFDPLSCNSKEKEEAHTLYLRPETTQGIMTAFLNVYNSADKPKLPFGIAQVGKSFRNELSPEHSIFRTLEFEQMEAEFFTTEDSKNALMEQLKEERLKWWGSLLDPKKIRVREHSPNELAHYAQRCIDIEYEFPWGYSEIEGIADRGQFDLLQHSQASSQELLVTNDNEKIVPHVIESSAGVGRGLLAVLCDSYYNVKQKETLRLPCRITPFKVAIFSIVSTKDLMDKARDVQKLFEEEEIFPMLNISDDRIGKKYYQSDEIGVPYCITIDSNTLRDNTATVRFRDSTRQETISVENLVSFVKYNLKINKTL